MNVLAYREGSWKYQLEQIYEGHTDILGYTVNSDFATLDYNGLMTVFRDFTWDGASGPTIDSDYTMHPALEHDVFYRWLRMGLIPIELRGMIDKFLRDRLVQCGYYDIEQEPSTGWFKWIKTKGRKFVVRKRAKAWLKGVTWGAEGAATDADSEKIRTLKYPDFQPLAQVR